MPRSGDGRSGSGLAASSASSADLSSTSRTSGVAPSRRRQPLAIESITWAAQTIEGAFRMAGERDLADCIRTSRRRVTRRQAVEEPEQEGPPCRRPRKRCFCGGPATYSVLEWRQVAYSQLLRSKRKRVLRQPSDAESLEGSILPSGYYPSWKVACLTRRRDPV